MNEYEKNMAELEEILARLEKGQQPLEASLADYERGLALAKACSAKLDEATGRIEKLTREGRVELDEDGNERV